MSKEVKYNENIKRREVIDIPLKLFLV